MRIPRYCKKASTPCNPPVRGKSRTGAAVSCLALGGLDGFRLQWRFFIFLPSDAGQAFLSRCASAPRFDCNLGPRSAALRPQIIRGVGWVRYCTCAARPAKENGKTARADTLTKNYSTSIIGESTAHPIHKPAVILSRLDSRNVQLRKRISSPPYMYVLHTHIEPCYRYMYNLARQMHTMLASHRASRFVLAIQDSNRCRCASCRNRSRRNEVADRALRRWMHAEVLPTPASRTAG